MNKKIIIFANTSWFLFNFNLNLMLHLQKLGYEVVALAPEDDYSTRFAEYGISFNAITMDNKGTNPIKDGLLFVRLVLLLLKQKPACLLSYTPKSNIYASLAARLLHIPIINNISGLGTAFIREDWLTKIVKWLYRLSLKKSSKVFLLNEDDLTIFINNNLVQAEKTELLPGPGVDVQQFSPSDKPNHNKNFIFLLVARMLKDKGIGEFVEATHLLKVQYPHIECQLLGFLDAKSPSAISSAEMQEWVDEGIVNYLGVSDSVVDYLRLADCVVLPSYYREGMPRCLLEAASVGKPIITTDWIGCREVVDDGVNGYLCEPRNINDLKDKMEQMLLLPEWERFQMGYNGREKVLKQFDEQIIIDRYVKAIEQVYG
ncbi:MAG: glycosyltransferase family 4 protein [Methylobacter sp.]|nr:glycosyltransferase family 4 protein [Methylobacter sp.]